MRKIGHRLAIEEREQSGRPRVARRAVEHLADCQLIRRQSRYICEGPLCSFEHHFIGRSNDNALHDGTCKEAVLYGIESAAYTFLCGKEHDLIARLEIEVTEADKLECAAESDVPIYGQQIVLVGGKASH